MTVPARCPERNSCIARTIAARSCPASRGTGDVTVAEAGGDPEHEAGAARGAPRSRRPQPWASLHHRETVVLQRERADALAGGGEVRVQDRRRRHTDGRL